jgi:hypothetical protein
MSSTNDHNDKTQIASLDSNTKKNVKHSQAKPTWQKNIWPLLN